jgi:hypothetical protein
MLMRVEELEAGVQRRIDEGFSHGVQTMVESQERLERVWEERMKWERYQHSEEMEELKRKVGDLREKLRNKDGNSNHDDKEYRRTKYVPNKIDGRYANRPRYDNNCRYKNRYNNNNNNKNYRPAPRKNHQPIVQRRGPIPSGSNSRPGKTPAVCVTLAIKETPEMVRTPGSAVAASCSRADSSKTDYHVWEQEATKVTDILTKDVV